MGFFRQRLPRPHIPRTRRPLVPYPHTNKLRWLATLAGVLWVVGYHYYDNYALYQCLGANVKTELTHHHTRGLYVNYTVKALVDATIVTRLIVLQSMSHADITGLYYQAYWALVEQDAFHANMCYQARDRPDLPQLRDTSVYRKYLYLDLVYDVEREINRRLQRT